MPKKWQVPRPANPKQGRELIWEGLGYFVREKPMTFWPLFALLLGSNSTAWYKALFDDTVSIRPVTENVRSSSLVMPEAVAAGPYEAVGDRSFEADTNWVLLKWKNENTIRIRTPKNRYYDVDAEWLEKLK